MKMFLKSLSRACLVAGTCFAAFGAHAQAERAMDRHLTALENMLPALTDMASGCREDECAPRVCAGKLDVFRDLSNIEPVLNRYVLLLNAEDALLTRSTDDAIANNDRSAAALEGARVAASVTHVTDQMLGAVVELNGIAGFVTSPSSDPEAIWEAAKDVNSIVNRLYDGWADTGNQIESVRYNPELASGEGTGVNLKNLEDAYIDIWAVGPKAAAGLIPSDLRELGSGVDPVQVVKDNTSNAVEVWATAKGILEEVAKLKRTKELGALIEDAGQGYVDRALPHLKDATRKRVDAAIKEQQALAGGQKRKVANAVAFGLTQVAARLVQNYYSKEKLQAFRNRISQLRDMNKKAGDAYLDLIVERDMVRNNSRKVVRLLEKVRSISSDLRECAFRKCGGNYTSIPMVTLPPVGKRNGNVTYTQGKLEIEPIMAALVGSLSSNLANGGGTTPRFPQGTHISGPSFFGSGNGPACEACQSYHDDAAGISRQIEMILWRLDAMEDQGDLAELKYQRNVSLRDAEGWQAEYNRRTDGSIGRRLKNLTDDEIQGLSELGSQIRRATSRVKALGQQIRAIEATERQTALLKQELKTLRDQEKAALERLALCNRKVCGQGLSMSELQRSSSLFEAEAARTEECRKEDKVPAETAEIADTPKDPFEAAALAFESAAQSFFEANPPPPSDRADEIYGNNAPNLTREGALAAEKKNKAVCARHEAANPKDQCGFAIGELSALKFGPDVRKRFSRAAVDPNAPIAVAGAAKPVQSAQAPDSSARDEAATQARWVSNKGHVISISGASPETGAPDGGAVFYPHAKELERLYKSARAAYRQSRGQDNDTKRRARSERFTQIEDLWDRVEPYQHALKNRSRGTSEVLGFGFMVHPAALMRQIRDRGGVRLEIRQQFDDIELFYDEAWFDGYALVASGKINSDMVRKGLGSNYQPFVEVAQKVLTGQPFWLMCENAQVATPSGGEKPYAGMTCQVYGPEAEIWSYEEKRDPTTRRHEGQVGNRMWRAVSFRVERVEN